MPVVALRGLTILPEMVVHFDVSRECSINAVNAAMEEEGQKLFLTAQKDPEIDMPEAEDLHKIGCVAVIKQIINCRRISCVYWLQENAGQSLQSLK